jgi:hypothetical protein
MVSKHFAEDDALLCWIGLRPDQRTVQRATLDLYRMLFALLRICPTYELARKAAIGCLSAHERAQLPVDFDHVQSTFDLLGDVRQIFFADWWRTRGLPAFGSLEPPQVRSVAYIPSLGTPTKDSLLDDLETYCAHQRVEDGMPETVLLAIPLGRSDVLQEVKRVLQLYEEHLQPAAPRFHLQKDASKIDADYLSRGVERLLRRAASDDRLWEIEAKCRPRNDPWVIGVNPGAWHVAKKSREDECRRNLAQTLNRYLRTFERYAENAARARFPSDARVTHTKYDYRAIGRRIVRIRSWEIAMKNRQARRATSRVTRLAG